MMIIIPVKTVNYSGLFFSFLQIFQGLSLFVCFEVYGLKKTDHFDFFFSLIGLQRKSIKRNIPSPPPPSKIATVGLV